MARVSYAFPLKYNPPAMRVRDVSYTKNHLSVIIGLFRPLLKGRKGDFNGKANEFARTYEVDV